MSEFGKGFTYCLAMFLKHAERYDHDKRIYEKNSMDSFVLASSWFNGSSDHLYELEIPENLNDGLKSRIKTFQDKCLDLGHGSGLFDDSVTEEDVKWSIRECLDILMEIDKQFGIEIEKGGCE